jgi:DNA-binding NtrC family response regulator
MELSHDNDNSILLVDDEPDIATVLKQSLEKLGFQVFAFTDPLVALEHFQIDSKEYGLVMSDLRMPAMNGYEFVKKVKKIKPEVKVFLMTAFEIDEAEFSKLLKSVKIDEFIQKPISFKDLARLVSDHILIQKKPGYQQSYAEHYA